MSYLSIQEWDDYKAAINGVAGDFNKKNITWLRLNMSLPRHGEGNAENTYDTRILECLIQYNYFRTWPLTEQTETGDIDKENLLLILNIKYLKDIGFWDNTKNYFDFKPGEDRFIIDSIVYKASGDTPVSQASDEDLLFYVVLTRDQKATGEEFYR